MALYSGNKEKWHSFLDSHVIDFVEFIIACKVEKQKKGITWCLRDGQFVLSHLLLQSPVGAIRSTANEPVTQPFDLAKTRLQLQNTANAMNGVKTPSRGLWRTMTGVVREEGFWALFGGVGPAARRQVIYGGICTGFYKPLRRLMYPGEENENLSFPKRLCVSLITGISGQTCSLPLDLIKVRMQADGRLKMMGEKPRYKSATDAFFTIIREEGVKAFFTGVSPTLIRAGLLTVGGIACYDSSKEWIMRHFHTSDATTSGRIINCTCASIYSGRMCRQLLTRLCLDLHEQPV